MNVVRESRRACSLASLVAMASQPEKWGTRP